MGRIVNAMSVMTCLALAACQPTTPTAESLDRRTPVPLPPEAVEAVRAEMRTMLKSLNELHQGLATRDTALVRRAALASGMAAAEDPALEDLLPAEFSRLAAATHTGFDTLALAIGAREPADSSFLRLSRITTNCVACHAIYRLVPSDEPHMP